MNYCLGYYLMPHPPIIIPEVGKGEEKKIQNTINACKRIGKEISQLKPETIIVVTPHGPSFSDAIALSSEEMISGNLAKFRAPSIKMEYKIDKELTNLIMELSNIEDIQTVGTTESMLSYYKRNYELDHGSIVPLYFVNQFYKDYQIVHITYGMLSSLELYHFGMLIRQAISQIKRKTVVIASGDLSHRLSEDSEYSHTTEGEVFDKTILSLLEKGDSLGIFNMDKKVIEEAYECGYRSIAVLLGIMGEFKGFKLSYEAPFGVGYGVMSFQVYKDTNLLEELKNVQKRKLEDKIKHSDCYVKLARDSLMYYFKHGKLIEVPENLPDDLITNRKGVFVSLKKDGNLRGCIGTFLPTTQSIAQEIIQNSIEAAFKDPRFSPVEEKELVDLEISVDVLNEPEKASVEDLEPKIYGVIVTQGTKRGLLLPNLKGVNTTKEQINIACEKAGINPNSHFDLERFKVERHIEGGC